jgi:hypothetical protein
MPCRSTTSMPIEQSEAEIISAWQMLTDDGVAEI